MSQFIALCATMAALAFALASLIGDYRRAFHHRRAIRRQLERIKGQEVRWTIRTIGKDI